jgi:poly(hydroxyalkanoate) depolymerase family esterase
MTIKRLLNKYKFKSLFFFLFISHSSYSQPLSEEIMDFGLNPGNLSLFYYAPKNIKPNAPMVVVLHGCGQGATAAAELTGWNKLAEEYGFYVMYPQQHFPNNPQHCFNWFKNNEIERGKGECESIKQMVDYMLKKFKIDNTAIFVTGMSAGGAMSTVMIATQPGMFKAAAIFAGGPYKPGSNIFSSSGSMVWGVNKTPEEWGDLVWRQNPAFKEKYPRVLIFHGTKDPVVNFRSAHEIVEQWTYLHNADSVPTTIDSAYLGAPDVTRFAYQNKEREEAVVFYKVNDLGHALPVNPGECGNEGGKTGVFATDKNFYSTYYTACEFGLIPGWKVEGPDEVAAGSAVKFSIPTVGQKKAYINTWKFPADCKVVGDDTGTTIELIWGKTNGKITLEEMAPNGCRYYHSTVNVKLKTN